MKNTYDTRSIIGNNARNKAHNDTATAVRKSESDVILEAHNLNKVYQVAKGRPVPVLRDVSFSVRRGEYVAVMGPSGSGKSTLLYNISGMDQPTSGSVRFRGVELVGRSEEALADIRLEKMGFIFQQSNLLKNLNILDNIVLPAFALGKEKRETIVARAEKLLEQTGVAEIADNDITQASGGQLQRVAICRALMNHPEMLFGDEPTGALNSKATAEVMDVLLGINQCGTTMMLVTHSPRVAAQSDRVVYMADGVIAGELRLGKYSTDTSSDESLEAREKKLLAWLEENRF